jgi:RHS repeat-associated protein
VTIRSGRICKTSFRARLALAACVGLLAGATTIPASAAAGSTATPDRSRPPASTSGGVSKVGYLTFARTRPAYPPVPLYQPTDASWPAPGSALVSVLTDKGAARNLTASRRAVLVGGLPVFADRPPGGPMRVIVRVLSHHVAAAAGIPGVVLTARIPGGHRGGITRLGVRYARFQQAYGGYYGTGLGLAVLPSCALTQPARAACTVEQPLASVNDWAARTISADVTLRPGRTVVLAVTPAVTAGGGPGGTYGATQLRPSGTWTAGGSAGSFNYSYPVSVSPASGGLAPAVSLDYDSGTVDGQTADTQPQGSWVGDGWTLPQSYIEQSFSPCASKPEGSAAPQKTQDDCYNGPVLTLSLDGASNPLVCPTTSFSYSKNSTCAESADTGAVITHHVGSKNGQDTKFADYWTMTTRDGTTYYFGLNHLPGWRRGQVASDSVDSVPVFSAHAGDPCHSKAGFARSACTMAYRWNLDYVTDVHGNAMAYYYARSLNAYAERGRHVGVPYTRDSELSRIDYGFRVGQAYAGHAPEHVIFALAKRCFAKRCGPTGPRKFWGDVPYFDACSAGKKCSIAMPTFWSTVVLGSVTTAIWNGRKYVPADSWNLGHSFRQTDMTANLWLDSITRSGQDTTAGGRVVSLPTVSFRPVALQNRVNPGTELRLNRDRIGQIVTEIGSVITVTYTLPSPCPVKGARSVSTNQSSCFPEYWGPFFPGKGGEGADWFNKWAVGSVQVSDPAGRSPGLFTSYIYRDPAWHYDDNELVQPQYRTYGQWRGYQHVITYIGDTSSRTATLTTYYQGMSHDFKAGTLMLPDSQGGRHEDADQLAGDILETTTDDYAGGPINNSQINSYWVSPAVMTRTRSGLPPLVATMTGQVEQWTRQALTDPGQPLSWRKTETDTSYDVDSNSPFFGLPQFLFRHGDLGDSSQQTCTAITYAAVNKSANLVGLPAETEVDAAPCSGSNPDGESAPGPGQVNALSAPTGLNKPTDVISDSRTFYDDPALARTWPQPAHPSWPQAPPGNSDVSVTQNAGGFASGAFSYQTSSTAVYDSLGRVTASYDGRGGFDGRRYHPTTTAYTMTAGNTTATRMTNPLGHSVTTRLDPLRALPVQITDANHVTTTMHYDGLGRLIDVWENSRPISKAPTFAYSYQVSRRGPVVVTTKQFTDSPGAIVSTTLYDSLLRVRQTQSPAPAGGILVSDNFYDNHGWLAMAYTNWFDHKPGAHAGAAILSEPQDQVANRTTTQYDGLGRAVIVKSYDGTKHISTAYTGYYGDRATILPPSGGTPTATITDALGRTSELDTYTSLPKVSAISHRGFVSAEITGGTFQPTTYAYNARGWLATITDAGRIWTNSYNLLGQITAQSSPDAGTSDMSYDAAGNLSSTTNADGQTISYTYDPLSRLTSEHAGSTATSPTIAAWVYDNANRAVPRMSDPVGQLTTATAFDSHGHAYTLQQTGFNAFGESTGQTITIPRTPATGPLAGTHRQHESFTNLSGWPLTTTYPASPRGGALPSETVTNIYCVGLEVLCGVKSNLMAVYDQRIVYTQLSQVKHEEIGATSTRLSDAYDQHTGNLTKSQVTPAKGNPYDTTSYSFDASGNLTSQTDVRDPNAGQQTQTEAQCYGYNLLGQLTQAWTTNGRASCQTGPSAGTVRDGIPGGAYWTSWSYNPAGNQTVLTQHALSGGPGSVTKYDYNNGQGTSTGQPDTLTSATTAGGGTATYTYDPTGNTLTRGLSTGKQTLTWTPLGQLASDTVSAGTTSYQYDADGNLLLQQSPSQTTLYLFNEQLTWTRTGKSAGQVNGIRILPLPGGPDVVRTGKGTAYAYQFTDLRGTSLLTLNHSGTGPIWRQYTPYGAPRGKNLGAWPDTNGYLNAPASTGLSLLGARAYDPSTGRFLSTDPLVGSTSAAQFNGYSYAADNPTTRSDPSGLYLPAEGGPCYSSYELGCVDAALQNPPLILTSLAAGAASAAFTLALSSVALWSDSVGAPELGTWLRTSVPDPFVNTHPNNPSFRVGYGIVFAAGLLIPGGDEATAADLGIGSVGGVAADTLTGTGVASERLAIAAAPERLAITAAPERVAPSGLDFETRFAVDGNGTITDLSGESGARFSVDRSGVVTDQFATGPGTDQGTASALERNMEAARVVTERREFDETTYNLGHSGENGADFILNVEGALARVPPTGSSAEVPVGQLPILSSQHAVGTVNDPVTSLFVNGAVALRVIALLLSRLFGGGG